MTLSEVCQNIVEHAGRGGWVAVQTYTLAEAARRRRVVVIAVCDAGRRIPAVAGDRARAPAERSLGRRHGARGGRDARREPVSGPRPRSRACRRPALSSDDGTASFQFAAAPPESRSCRAWDEDVPLRRRTLAPFPGAQVQITIPERVPAVINHIDVSSMLRRTVCDLYSNLVTRPTGAAVRTEIEQAARRVRRPRADGDRLLPRRAARLLLRRRDRRQAAAALLRRAGRRARPISSSAAERSHLDAIEAVLERHGLAMVSQLSDGSRRSDRRRHVARALGLGDNVRLGGGASADGARARSGLAKADAERMLDILWRKRLVIRTTRIRGGGRAHVSHARPAVEGGPVHCDPGGRCGAGPAEVRLRRLLTRDFSAAS